MYYRKELEEESLENSMKTTVYFVRHVEPDFNDHDDKNRPLTEKGLRDRIFVSDYLTDKHIVAVFPALTSVR